MSSALIKKPYDALGIGCHIQGFLFSVEAARRH
jgi:hypothetical protein